MTEPNFWDYHGWWFILAMFFFPRLTMLFATTTGAGFLYWLGWTLAPRLAVAIIGTSLFWQHNTVLVVFTWLWALGVDCTAFQIADAGQGETPPERRKGKKK